MRRRELVAGLAFAAVLALGPPATAELSQPVLLGDLGQVPTTAQPSYGFTGSVHFVPFAGATFFTAWDGARGHELWRSDGTPAGTAIVRDLCPGSCNGRVDVELVVAAGALFFSAVDGAHGEELWKSDGTADGTVLVKDVKPGLRSSAPSFLTPAPGGIYFVAADGSHGIELWFSDGTSAGTHLVADLLPGDPGPNYPLIDAGGPTHLAMLGSELLFGAEDDVHGRELWKTNGTLAGTTLVKDLVPGSQPSIYAYQAWPFAAESPVVAGGRVFFAGKLAAGSNVVVPWASDGTTAGTVPLMTGPLGEFWNTRSFFAFGDDVLFNAGTSGSRTLWRSNGTPAGTVALGTAANGGEQLDPSGLTQLGDGVYFRGVQSSTGAEPWVTDGTVAGTHLVANVGAGAASGLESSLFGFAAAGGRLFFPADDGVHGLELWSSDGEAAGTVMVSDLVPGSGSAFVDVSPTYPSANGGQLFFRAWDGEQWGIRALDLQSGVQQRLHANADPAGSAAFCTLGPCAGAMPAGNGFAFVAVDVAHGGEPWLTDGTAGGTQLVADLQAGTGWSMPGLAASLFASLPETLLMVGWPADGVAQLWSFDGADSIQLTDADADSIFGVREVVAWQGHGFFSVGNGEDGLWKTDGTVAGTVELQGNIGSFLLTPAASSLFFLGPISQLWVTDGTAAQTHPVTPSSYVQVWYLAAAMDEAGADRVYMVARDASSGWELWVSDGSEAGTRLVIDLRAGDADAIPLDAGTWPYDPAVLVGLGSRAVFIADAGNGAGEELWVSDGAPGNATLLEVRPGAAGAEPRALTVLGDRVYFVADDGVHGRELWVTDGTPAGTHLVADVRPGPESSTPTDLEAWKDQLVFAADDGVHGMELWQTAEVRSGTGAELVVDLRPGIAPSSPQGLTHNGDALTFFADDGATGLEPWAIFTRRPLLVDAFESGDLGKWSAGTPSP